MASYSDYTLFQPAAKYGVGDTANTALYRGVDGSVIDESQYRKLLLDALPYKTQTNSFGDASGAAYNGATDSQLLSYINALKNPLPNVSNYSDLVNYANQYVNRQNALNGTTGTVRDFSEFNSLSPSVQAAILANPELAVKSMQATANKANGDWLSLGAEGGLNNASDWQWGPDGLTYNQSAYKPVHENGWERLTNFVDDNMTNIGLAMTGAGIAGGLAGAGGAANAGATAGAAAGGNSAGAGITSSELGALGGGSASAAAATAGAGGGFSAGNLGTAASVVSSLNSIGGNSTGTFTDPTTGLTYNSDGTGSGTLSGNYSGLLSSLFGSNGSAGAAILGGLLGSQNGAQQAGTTTTTVTPWSGQQPYLTDMFQKAQALSQTQPNTALTTQGQNTLSGIMSQNPTQGYGMNLSNPYAGQTTQAATNPYLGVDNPYLTSAIDSANNDVLRSYLPAMNSANVLSGSYGNSGVADIYSKNLADALAKNSNSMRMSDYTNQQNLTQNLSQFNANLAQNDLSRNSGLWNTDQSRNQQAYQYNRTAQQTAAQNSPQFSAQQYTNTWAPVTNYAQNIQGNYGNSTSTPYYTNPYSNILGGITTGLSLYNQYNNGSN